MDSKRYGFFRKMALKMSMKAIPPIHMTSKTSGVI